MTNRRLGKRSFFVVVVVIANLGGIPLFGHAQADVSRAIPYRTASSTLAVSASSLDFGEVKIKQCRKLSFTIRNTGEKTQNVSVSTIAPFDIHSEPSFKLKPGRSRTIKVQFAPPIVSSFIGLAELTSGDHSLTLTLVGAGVL